MLLNLVLILQQKQRCNGNNTNIDYNSVYLTFFLPKHKQLQLNLLKRSLYLEM